MLSNKHIVLTHFGSTDYFQILKEYGAVLHHFPMIDIVPNSDVKAFNLSNFDYYIFTSKNGVNSFFNLDFLKGETVNAICLGEKTQAALTKNGVESVFVSAESYAENLITELLETQILKGKKVLLVLGNLVDNKIEEGLKNICEVNRLNVYTTNLITTKKEVITTLIDTENSLSVFTSPSAFHAFSSLYEADKTTLVSIGTTTSDYMNSKGFISEIISDEQTYEGISNAIINHYETKNIRI